MAFRRIEPNQKAKEAEGRGGKFRRLEPSTSPQFAQSKAASIANAAAKGLTQGTLESGQTASALGDPVGSLLKQLAQRFSGGKSHQEKVGEHVEENLEEFLPSKEGLAESLAQRGGRLAPGLLVGPGGAAVKAGSILGGTIGGELAEEAGWGPTGQAFAEALGATAGGFRPKGLAPRAGSEQEKLINFARKHGLSDKEIAPALQTGKKVGLLAPITHRGPGTIGRIAESRTAIGRIYEKLEKSPAAQKAFSKPEKASLVDDLSSELQKLPRELRKKVSPDVQDLLRSTPNGATTMDLYRDINYYIGKGEGRLGGIQKTLEKHLTGHLGDEFSNANKLFGNVKKLGIRVRPDLASHFHDYKNAAELSQAILEKNKNGLVRALTEITSRFTASKALVSPSLQHIPKKILESAARGNFEDAKKVLTIMLNKGEKKEEKE